MMRKETSDRFTLKMTASLSEPNDPVGRFSPATMTGDGYFDSQAGNLCHRGRLTLLVNADQVRGSCYTSPDRVPDTCRTQVVQAWSRMPLAGGLQRIELTGSQPAIEAPGARTKISTRRFWARALGLFEGTRGWCGP